ncbi:NACHT domain-containing protein [Roseiflexus castenholzii]|uniref:Putative signal transduction protein with Nacht domain n=1 Tax=Roseiflexus castenholzii (strain DSM 13941 / HLO8) TaxID=383372 RepID=A7NJM4_ROSCS|nr:signal transduction protein [Roseiflexus castenholzii]ABU57694.1 putative signal transduction protein with Nacht domain [Roseiflexus castenholzii DSM 13941]
MISPNDLFTNLAASLAYDLLKAGAARLTTFVSGSPEEQTLRRCYQSAFAAMLSEVTASLDDAHQELVEYILRQFVIQPQVAEGLLALALKGADLPDLPRLRQHFDALGFDRATLPVDFDVALAAFTRGLTEALLDEAVRPGSPLYNRVSLGRVLALHALLQQQGKTLEEIRDAIRRLDAHGGATYNVIIARATGVAIGDGARVEAALPADVRDLLQQILQALKPPPDYTDADLLNAYLDWLIRQHSTLELRGIHRAGPSLAVPLERVYAALQAETVPPTEWQESYRLLEEDLQAWLEQQGLDDLAEAERRRYRWRFLAGHPLMPALEERDRPRLFSDRKAETLDLAQAVRRFRWLVILGDPGSGKTTLLRWLTLHLARALREGADRVRVPAMHVDAEADEDAPPVDLGPARLPVLVRIGDYAEARRATQARSEPPPSLLEFLGHHGWQRDFPTFGREHLRRGERLPADGLRRLIRDFFRRGQAMLLLDSLDEITAADDRREIIGAVESFLQEWITDPGGRSPLDPGALPWRDAGALSPDESGGNQIIITSRIAGYHAAPLSLHLTHATLQPMSDAAVDRFCQTWTLAVHRLLADPGDSEEEVARRAADEAQALQAALHDPTRPGLRELAGNPLLLTILAMVHHNSQARLPEQRVRLYQIAVENLVEVWRDTGLSEDEVVQVLAPLAAHIHERYPSGLIEENELREQVTHSLAEYRGENPDRPSPAFRRDVEAFLRAVRERVGLLSARGEAAYGFLHLTFQEYLAARHLAGDPNAALEAILARRDDPRWREPVLLALGYLSWSQNMAARGRLLRAFLEADDPLGDLLPRSALLMAAAIPEMTRTPPAIVEEVARRLLQACAARPVAWLRREVSAALARLHRREEASLLVERALVEALTAPPPPDAADPGPAAADLIREHKWFTPDLAEALVEALPRDLPGGLAHPPRPAGPGATGSPGPARRPPALPPRPAGRPRPGRTGGRRPRLAAPDPGPLRRTGREGLL